MINPAALSRELTPSPNNKQLASYHKQPAFCYLRNGLISIMITPSKSSSKPNLAGYCDIVLLKSGTVSGWPLTM